MILPQHLHTKFNASKVRLRSLDKHRRQCLLLDSAPGLSDSFSKTYGVNRLSILDQAPHFDVCRCLPHDIMHVILEGVLVLQCRRILAHCIREKGYFTTDTLNGQIKTFPYGYSEARTIPSPIDRDRLVSDNSTKLGQSASQMWLLGRLLPLMVGKHVPESDKHWKCYVQLLRVVTLATAVEITELTASTMTLLVQDYLRQYNQLYPGSMVPKLHYLIHLPQQMKLFGPLRNQWCMRFEAKNAHIKSMVGKNFKNLPYTIATKHQHYMCLQMLSAPGVEPSNFLYKGDEVGRGNAVELAGLPSGAREVAAEEFPGCSSVQSVSAVTVLGVEFRPGALVCLEISHEELPVFGGIDRIFVQGARTGILLAD